MWKGDVIEMKKKFLILFVLFLPLFVNAAEYCQDIYCNEFNYICCGQSEESYAPLVVKLYEYTPASGKDPVFCPTDSDVIKCEVNISATPDPWDLDDKYEYYRGTGVCDSQASKGWGWGKRWVCKNEEEYYISEGDSISDIVLKRGQKIYAWSDDQVSVTSAIIHRKVLRHTGKGTDSFAGEIVDGSVACDFNPSDFDKSYNESNQVVSQKKSLNSGECYAVTNKSLKRQCGDTCETCRNDSDCGEPPRTKVRGFLVAPVC